MKFIRYAKNGGQIVAFGHSNARLDELEDADYGVIEADDLDSDIVAFTVEQKRVDPALKSLVNRPMGTSRLNKNSIPADSRSVAKLKTPAGAIVTVHLPGDTVVITSNGDDIDLTFDQPGRYKITVSAFPETDKEFFVDAT